MCISNSGLSDKTKTKHKIKVIAKPKGSCVKIRYYSYTLPLGAIKS